MTEGIALGLALLLIMVAAIAYCWRWQQEQEAKAIVTAIRRSDRAELLIVLAGVPRFDLVAACFGEPVLVLCVASRAATEILELLLDRGADANERGTEWRTALLHAARLGDADFSRTLLEHGADPLACDIWGRTAAQIASESGYYELSCWIGQAGRLR